MNACGHCGAPARAPFRAPPPELAPDLDLRPGEPTRSTLPRWIATCPSCGASAPDLSQLSASLPNLGAEPDPFLRWSAIAEAQGDLRSAAEAVLQAAWVADDAGDDLRAAALRRRALSAWGEPADVQDALRLLDVARRSGDFVGASARCDALHGRTLDEQSAAILAFQRDRIAAQDPSRHLISSALRPPARRPHVSHKQAARRGLWQRMTGH